MMTKLGKYKEPEAHHWIVLRLVRRLFKTHNGHGVDAGRSVLWLIREVGSNRVIKMIDQLADEEANNVR